MIRTFQIRCIVLTILVQTACGFAGDGAPGPPAAEKPQVKSTLQLKRQVDELLAAGDSVMIRRNIGDVFALVDRLTKSGQQEQAFTYLSAGLQHQPWALDYQLIFAEMLLARGMADLACERAQLVLKYAEQDEQVNRARKLLQQGPLPPVPRAETVPGDATTLVLVPVGTVDTCVLEELQGILQARLAIPVLVRDARVRVPRFKREPIEGYLAKMRASLQEMMEKDRQLVESLRSKEIRPGDLEKDSVVAKAWRELVSASGDAELLAKFDATMNQLREADKQWDMDDLLNSLRVAVRPFRQNHVYFLGVANLDAFRGESNFVFGTAETGGHHAVLAYRRFTAAFNGDTPNRRRLVDRMLKQALSSVGFMLGVGRCSSPVCARAYPHSLSEHDAKSTELCNACALCFERVLGVDLPQSDQTRP